MVAAALDATDKDIRNGVPPPTTDAAVAITSGRIGAPPPDPAREAVLKELYDQALAELQAERPAGISLLDSLLIEDPSYRDAAARRDAARQKYQLTIGDKSVKRSRPRLVVFDLNDSLVGTESLVYQATRDVISEYSDTHRTISLDSYASYVGIDSVKLFSELAHQYEIRGKTPTELVREREERYRILLQDADPYSLLNPGFQSTLKLLESRGVKMAICSSSSKRRVQETLDRVGIAHYFAAYATLDQGMAAWPSPEMYLALLRDVDVEPSDCVAVESSLLGLSASVAAGCFTLLLYTNFTAPVRFPRPDVEPIYNSQLLAKWFKDLLKADHTWR